MNDSWQKNFDDAVQEFAEGRYHHALPIFQRCTNEAEAQSNNTCLIKSLSCWGDTCVELGQLPCPRMLFQGNREDARWG